MCKLHKANLYNSYSQPSTVLGDYFKGHKTKKREKETSQEVTTWETDIKRDIKKSIAQPNCIAPWCEVLPDTITCPQPAERSSAFYGTRRFITVLHLSPSPS